MDFQACIEKYDRVGTLFYIDPPYYRNEKDYGKDLFTRGDFVRLRDCLRGIKGRFILSLNDVPEVRELFAEFTIEPVTLTYSVAKKAATQAKEVIISN